MKIRELLQEFAISPGGDGGNDGFNEETLKRLAAQWFRNDEDPRVEQTLAAAGWEIGWDEGYEPEWGVFVVQSGDVNGRSYISWGPEELRGIQEDKPPSRYLTGKEKVKNISPVLTKPYGKAKQTALMKNFFGSS